MSLTTIAIIAIVTSIILVGATVYGLYLWMRDIEMFNAAKQKYDENMREWHYLEELESKRREEEYRYEQERRKQ